MNKNKDKQLVDSINILYKEIRELNKELDSKYKKTTQKERE